MISYFRNPNSYLTQNSTDGSSSTRIFSLGSSGGVPLFTGASATGPNSLEGVETENGGGLNGNNEEGGSGNGGVEEKEGGPNALRGKKNRVGPVFCYTDPPPKNKII